MPAVTDSTFGVVTTLLALFILNERITLLQWTGIVLVFGGGFLSCLAMKLITTRFGQ